MKVLLRCEQCGYEEWGTREGILMNKIKMWNHLKRVHAMRAERLMREHDILPSNFFRTLTPAEGKRPVSDIRPRWASI